MKTGIVSYVMFAVSSLAALLAFSTAQWFVAGWCVLATGYWGVKLWREVL